LKYHWGKANNMTTGEIILAIASLFSANYGSHLLRDYLAHRRARKSQDDNMEEDYRRQQVIKPLLEDLRYHLDANRVVEIAFSNGDTTLGGHHLKKISIITETDPANGEEVLAPHFQLIPARKFDRTLAGLYESAEDWIVWDEVQHKDETAALNRAFGLNTILLAAIRNQDNKWVGYLMVSWTEQREPLVESEIERVRLVAARIGAMCKQYKS
jgi:hypothetical protein